MSIGFSSVEGSLAKWINQEQYKPIAGPHIVKAKLSHSNLNRLAMSFKKNDENNKDKSSIMRGSY